MVVKMVDTKDLQKVVRLAASLDMRMAGLKVSMMDCYLVALMAVLKVEQTEVWTVDKLVSKMVDQRAKNLVLMLADSKVDMTVE